MAALHDDPRWPRASAWLQGTHDPDPAGTLGVLGVPMNVSITPGRCDLAPGAVRAALARLTTYDTEHGVDAARLDAGDAGDAPPHSTEAIVARVAHGLAEYDVLVLLGGDNGVTHPGVHGLAAALGVGLDRIGLVTLDAHLDLRHLEAGLHNGNPVRALLRDGLPGSNVSQIGLQSFANSRAYAQVAAEAGIRVVTADQARNFGLALTLERELLRLERTVDAVYLDLDVDCLDRAYAPACPGARPGGFMPWEVRQAAHSAGLHGIVKVIDLVEIDPRNDEGERTCLAAGTFLMAFATGVVRRLEPGAPA